MTAARIALARTAIRAAAAAAEGGIYLGAGTRGPRWAGPERAALILGPPRSGKSSCVVVPAILTAPGAVVSTSTKPDILEATAPARADIGPCLLYDPSGTVPVPPGVEPVRWSPIASCADWDETLLVARSLVLTARSVSREDHWSGRAEALLGAVLHAAALDGTGMRTVLGWIDRHQGAPALAVLDREGAEGAANQLAGIMMTDSREQSGIWSTASGVLAAYRSSAALDSTVSPNFDPFRFLDQRGTLYICATGRHQAVTAPLVVGILNDVRAAAYARSSARVGGPPVLLALDEVANIAPLPDLPAMVSEGGGQGLLTLACLQDLSQARLRWGQAAEGFLSLFGSTVVLPGIGDVRTLESLSALAGEEEVLTRSMSVPLPPKGPTVARAFLRFLGGRRVGPEPDRVPSLTTSTVRRPRLPVDELSQGRPGSALVVGDRNRMSWVRLTPYFAEEPWRTATRAGPGLEPGRERLGPERDLEGRDPGPDLGR